MKKNESMTYEELCEENARLKYELLCCARRLHNQKREITTIQEAQRLKNVALDAMLWVWCDGGCSGGVSRFHPNTLTERVVRLAESNTKRLRRWYTNRKWKEAQRFMTPEQFKAFCGDDKTKQS